jgi:hypothetical protein
MPLGSRRGWLALGILLGCSVSVPRAADKSTTELPAVLSVRLSTSSELSPVSRQALIRETESIWRDARVELRWLADGADQEKQTAEQGRPLRIVVTRRVVNVAGHQRWTLGELLRFGDHGAVAMASITAALRIVEESPQSPLVDLPTTYQYKLGVVLGRAVAHEIGHYLLDSNSHSPYGLMRASIDAKEFADLRTGGFRLDRESQAYLATRVRGD